MLQLVTPCCNTQLCSELRTLADAVLTAAVHLTSRLPPCGFGDSNSSSCTTSCTQHACASLKNGPSHQKLSGSCACMTSDGTRQSANNCYSSTPNSLTRKHTLTCRCNIPNARLVFMQTTTGAQNFNLLQTLLQQFLPTMQR